MRVGCALLLATALWWPVPRASAEYDYFPHLITLIAQLANLAAEADHCERQLTLYARKGLASEACTSFKKHYYAQWPDREALQDEILSYVLRAEAGEFVCDERCRNMLLRCEELRIIITYTLDYMEFALDY